VFSWAIAALAFAVFLGLRIYAARRLGAASGGFVWLVFLPQTFVPAVLIWAGLTLIPRQSAAGVILAVVGLLLGSSAVLMLRRMSSGISTAKSSAAIAEAMIDSAADFFLRTIGFLLVVGFVGLVVLIISGFAQGLSQ
jgi:hypothetical protein